MNENKIQVSFSLDPDNGAQMLALANFALTLVEAKTGTIPQKTVAPVEREDAAPAALYGFTGKGTANEATVTTNEAAPVVTLTEEEKPKRKRRTAAEMKAENNAESEAAEVAESAPAEVESEDAAEEEEEEAPAPKSPPAASKITLDDVRRAVADKKEKHLQIMKFKLKEDFGVSKTPDLAPHQYEAFYNFLQSLD